MSALSVVAVDHYFAYGSNMNPARVRERGLRVTAVCGAWLKDRRLVFDKVSRFAGSESHQNPVHAKSAEFRASETPSATGRSRLHPNAAHANIAYAPGERVEGVLYKLARADEILKMDPFERAPWNYGRDAVQVQAGEDLIWAWTYFANRAVRRDGLSPPAEYLAHLLAGRDYLSADYFERLARTPVAECAGARGG